MNNNYKDLILPTKLTLGQENTPIQYLGKLSKKTGKNIYVKRDDFTGIEMSGNKVKKLEYALAEALNQDAKVVITCGAIQSNHARATAAACRKLGLDVHLVLRGDEPKTYSGNLLINRIMGAKITFLSHDDFSNHQNVMENLKEQYEKSNKKAYIIPIGASNGIGNFGYFNAYLEILKQEKMMGISFDTIACTVGSGGTYSGLLLANYYNNSRKNIVGYSVGGSRTHFEEKIKFILNESLVILRRLNSEIAYDEQSLKFDIRDQYQGEGYAITNKNDIEFIKEIAQSEGVIFDPVYTGKAFRGLLTDINKKHLYDANNVLFIHTGGLLGLEAFSKWF